MKPYRINAVILRHAYEVRRNLNHITYMVYWPVVNIAVWGFFTLYLRHGDHLRPGVISCLLGRGHLVGTVQRLPTRHGGRISGRTVVAKSG
jgi:hypothetical protein